MMQDVSEMAGNLKAELLEIRDDARVGRITEEEALRRIRVIRMCAARARCQSTKTEQQPPAREQFAEQAKSAWSAILDGRWVERP